MRYDYRYGSQDPKPKFKEGDLVHVMNGSHVLFTGEIFRVLPYDDFVEDNRYKVKNVKGGSAITFNEKSLRRADDLGASSLAPPRQEHAPEMSRIHGSGIKNQRHLDAVVLKLLLKNHRKWEWTARLLEPQLERLSVMVSSSIWKSHMQHVRQMKRLKLSTPAPMTEEQIESYLPGQTRTYAPLVEPFDV